MPHGQPPGRPHGTKPRKEPATDSALIISGTERATTFFRDMLGAASVAQIIALTSASEARRMLLERDFDLVLINAPLRDETGEQLAREIAVRGVGQVILVVRTELFEAVAAVCEADGVLTVAKPINRALFWSALRLAAASQSRLKRMQAENSQLKQKLADLRIIERAKLILMTVLNMSEQEAHRTIEKQAMDLRVAKRTIAEGILKTYEH